MLADAHDLKRFCVEQDWPREDSRIAAEALLPEAVTDDADGMAALDAVIAVIEETSERGMHSEYAEVGTADQFAGNALGLVTGGQVHRHAAVRQRTRKRTHLAGQFAIHRVAEGVDVPT
ncbi:MAG: hypothetical protein ABSF54_29030 [Bryobacteraceae bacterium]